jgi:hypothetical protein
LLPVQLDELRCDATVTHFKCFAAVISKLDSKVSQSDQERELVRSSEITFGEQALQLGQEGQLLLW